MSELSREYIRRYVIFKGKARDMTKEAIERGWYQAKSMEALVRTEPWEFDETDYEILDRMRN